MADSWVRWYGDRVISEAEAAVERGLSKLAQQIRQEAQASMNLPKTGKKYKRLRTRSSAPYEAPAVQTGVLQSHVNVEQRGPMMRLIGVELGDDMTEDYGLFLEVGTSRMTERPYLRPALYNFTGRTGEEIFEKLM